MCFQLLEKQSYSARERERERLRMTGVRVGRKGEEEGGREIEIVHLLVHYPDGCNSHSWVSLKPQVRKSIRELPTRVQAVRPSAVSQEHQQGTGSEVEEQDSNQCSCGMLVLQVVVSCTVPKAI